MIKTDIGILFDVSGSMKTPFNSISKNNKHYIKVDELMNIIDTICKGGKNEKNEKIRIFSIIFGGKNHLIYDFCNLMDISNNTFSYTLTTSDNEKALNNKNGYGEKIKELLSVFGTVYIDRYLYGKEGPTERLCELGYYLMKGKKELCKKVYSKLPDNCKSGIRNIGVGFANLVDFSGSVQRDIDEGTKNVIEDIYKTCIQYYENEIIEKDISYRKTNDNKLIFKDGNDLKELKKNLENKLTTPKKKDFKLLDLFENNIYGTTPLYTALNVSFYNLQIQSENNRKFIFIISDGELNDIEGDLEPYKSEIIQKAQNLNTIIISIFLTSNEIPKEEKFYDETKKEHLSEGSEFLFSISSTLTYRDYIIKFFIQKGWDIPLSGECKLFVEINDSQNLHKFIDLMNEAISVLNETRNSEIPQNKNSLMNILNSTIINDYVASEIDKFNALQQNTNNCYAYAISVVLYFALKKIEARTPPSIKDLIEEITQKKALLKEKYKMHKYDKKYKIFWSTYKLLLIFSKKYNLQCRKVTEEGAKKAIFNTRLCVARFVLNNNQWMKFYKFFKDNKNGVLEEKDIECNSNEIEENERIGHAWILTHIAKDHLKFLSSWGTEKGEEGYFKVRNAKVLNIKFYDVFFDESNLTEEEKNYNEKLIEDLKKKIGQYIFD